MIKLPRGRTQMAEHTLQHADGLSRASIQRIMSETYQRALVRTPFIFEILASKADV